MDKQDFVVLHGTAVRVLGAERLVRARCEPYVTFSENSAGISRLRLNSHCFGRRHAFRFVR